MVNKDDRPVGDQPAISETQWQAAAIASALLSAVLGIAGSFWILGLVPPETIAPDDMAARGRALTPIGTFLIAIVTFCTVAWRAKVTERQADAQERQLASADENNLALLLQKGAELLADESEARFGAGVACLEAVALSQNGKYAVQALDIVSSYMQEHMSSVEKPNWKTGACLNVAAAAGTIGRRPLTDLVIDGVNMAWMPPPGISFFKFTNVIFDMEDSKYEAINAACIYNKCTFKKMIVDAEFWKNDSATFIECRIVKATTGLRYARFVKCDFSAAEFGRTVIMNPKQIQDCFYDEDFEPIFKVNGIADLVIPKLTVRKRKILFRKRIYSDR